MADRYQDRPFPAEDDYRGEAQHASGKGDSDPLAELARLIGQTDPFGAMGRANQPVQPAPVARNSYEPRETYRQDAYQQDAYPPEQDSYEEPSAADEDSGPAVGPPPWMQRANRQETAKQDFPTSVHPLHRYSAPQAAAEPEYDEEPAYAGQPDPGRYDDALYGEPDPGLQPESAYADDAYAYRDSYQEEDGFDDRPRKRRGGMFTVAMVLALAVVGTGAAFAYRAYIGSSRGGEPPIIKADTSPTKIVPAPADGPSKVPDRLASGDGSEKIVPREEAPVDVSAKSGPRVVFPPLNQNGSPPPAASVAPGSAPPPSATASGTLPNNEPRKIKTFTVRSDQPDSAATPVTSTPVAAKPAPAAPPKTAATPRSQPSAVNANASTANAPLSLAPQAAAPTEPRTRIAATNPTQIAPTSGSGYLVQVSSQRNEADAQASYRALQGKFPAVLGSRAPLIKRADLGEKGVYYRAMVGPFGSPDEASQFCGNLKSAGGQCVVQRN